MLFAGTKNQKFFWMADNLLQYSCLVTSNKHSHGTDYVGAKGYWCKWVRIYADADFSLRLSSMGV